MGTATLAEILADTLRQDLRDGVYLCGERIAESVIAKQFNVSQNTARDALKVLEGEGWLIKRPRHGMFVRRFDGLEAEELYTLRATLEQLVLEWAMQIMSERAKFNLAHIIAEARIQAGMKNDRALREAIGAFHEMILRSSNHPITMAVLQPILNQCRLLTNLRQRHDPVNQDIYAAVLTLYGNLITHIRYDDRKAAQNTLYAIIMSEREQVLSMLDLIV